MPLVAVVQRNTDAKVVGHNPHKMPRDCLLAVTGSPQYWYEACNSNVVLIGRQFWLD